jgi:hypothetical protein
MVLDQRSLENTSFMRPRLHKKWNISPVNNETFLLAGAYAPRYTACIVRSHVQQETGGTAYTLAAPASDRQGVLS